mmetsp:Transcript_55998/g.137273  ORF Transcript_55998/g.137273 Transcript_55998/m.137273 type:complete len:273 (+) Transcript_55998:135-953(+)
MRTRVPAMPRAGVDFNWPAPPGTIAVRLDQSRQKVQEERRLMALGHVLLADLLELLSRVRLVHVALDPRQEQPERHGGLGGRDAHHGPKEVVLRDVWCTLGKEILEPSKELVRVSFNLGVESGEVVLHVRPDGLDELEAAHVVADVRHDLLVKDTLVILCRDHLLEGTHELLSVNDGPLRSCLLVRLQAHEEGDGRRRHGGLAVGGGDDVEEVVHGHELALDSRMEGNNVCAVLLDDGISLGVEVGAVGPWCSGSRRKDRHGRKGKTPTESA